MTDFDIRRAWAKAIESTGDPLAPIVLQEAYAGAERLGRMMASISKEELVDEISNAFMSHWPGDEIDKAAAQPEFIMALCGLLCQSLVGYAKELQ